MLSEFTFIPGKRMYLLCSDKWGAEPIKQLIPQIQKVLLPFEWYHLGESLEEWLYPQKMGSFLYVAGSFPFVQQVNQTAQEVGFVEEEIQMLLVGPMPRQVFCSRCHSLHDVQLLQQDTVCPHCDLALEISDHYSRRWEAYLGYVKGGQPTYE